jgi:hypothetical protein
VQCSTVQYSAVQCSVVQDDEDHLPHSSGFRHGKLGSTAAKMVFELQLLMTGNK